MVRHLGGKGTSKLPRTSSKLVRTTSKGNLERVPFFMSFRYTYYIQNKVMTIEITEENFEETINTDKPVLIDFWAEWCGPCRMVGPIVDEISTEYTDKAVIVKINADQSMELMRKYGIRSIPTLLIFKNGEVVDKVVGAVPKQVITSKIDQYLN